MAYARRMPSQNAHRARTTCTPIPIRSARQADKIAHLTTEKCNYDAENLDMGNIGRMIVKQYGLRASI